MGRCKILTQSEQPGMFVVHKSAFLTWPMGEIPFLRAGQATCRFNHRLLLVDGQSHKPL